MNWTAPAPPEVDGPMVGDERAVLTGYLAWQRRTLLNICAGLDSQALAARPVPPSTLSLLGLLRHMTKVERIWLRIRIAGQQIASVYPLGTDVDFDDVDPARAQQEHARYVEECRLADAAAAGHDLAEVIEVRGEPMSVRMIYLHLCGEYARHNGHADLLRQRLDGSTGR